MYTLSENENKSLDDKLYILLCKVLESRYNGDLISDEIKEICQDVVYFVLNVTDIWNKRRAFHTGINWANLNNEVRENRLLCLDTKKASLSANNGRAGLIPFSTVRNFIPTNAKKEQLIIEWKIVWDQYYKLTLHYDGNADKKFFTFNHWLLHHTKNPLHIGVYWGLKDSHANKNYVYLQDSTLEEMGITTSQRTGSSLIKLPEFSGKFIDNGDLSQVLSIFNEMDPNEPELNSLENIAFSIYHLLRSYGCWGGNSFYSIPMNYGRDNHPIKGILSICSTKPLDSDLSLKWYLVANKLFKGIMLDEIDKIYEYERRDNLMEATYALGHNLKNRVLDGEKNIEEIKKDIEKEIDNINQKQPLKIDKNNILNKITNLGLQVKSLANTGNLLDLLAGSMADNQTNIFEKKEEWYSSNETSIASLLTNFYKDKFHVMSKYGHYGIVSIENLSEDLKINPWLSSEKNIKIRPHNFVYEEIFFELFVNALGYGKSFIQNNKNYVQIDVYNSDGNIIVSNTPETPLIDNKKFNNYEDGKEYPADLIAHGGLLYIYNFLKFTKTGSYTNMS